MLTQEIILKRLALIKHLYKMGLDQSRQSETLAAFSILFFHDSIEMFLKLIAEHQNINSEKYAFLDYWNNIPTLTLKESMRNVNSRRVNIKHKGLLPSKADIEITRVNTTDFFEQNTIIQLGIAFKDISLLSLVNYDKVRNYLEEAQKNLDNKANNICIENVAKAFEELIFTYENNKRNYYRESPFFFGADMTFNSSFHMGLRHAFHDRENNKMAEFVDKVKDSLEGIQQAIKIISLGIDYKRFVKFKLLTPRISRIHNQLNISQIWGNKKWTVENCQYCIDFVLDSSLKLQEFDFELKELEEEM